MGLVDGLHLEFAQNLFFWLMMNELQRQHRSFKRSLHASKHDVSHANIHNEWNPGTSTDPQNGSPQDTPPDPGGGAPPETGGW